MNTNLYYQIKILVPSLVVEDFLPGSGAVNISGNEIVKWDAARCGRAQPTQAELDAVAEDAAIYEQVIEVRASRVYPPITDQLDAIMKGGNALTKMQKICYDVKAAKQFSPEQLAFKEKYPTL